MKKSLKKKNKLWCAIKWVLLKMKIWWKTTFVIVSAIAIALFVIITTLHNEYKAVNACETLYNQKITEFADLTGINSSNVYFLPPQIIKSKNLYSMVWDNNIFIGADKDSFNCEYNFSTEKAFDRTK